ncbi:hypothetical protein EIL87_14475 [Saccharopolyspora rhizosphaerae]|uniref:DUF2975 domain-containing protein n=1 Tax=Saccharopolyspora rhizosphaerae TaxID=2492662 RepID=A0A426JSX1_9PSEU|nr:hypothetical protein [Saccharopolyspora rhizosphaerae]RRO16248.1 hypothetical protein EIL87_14475 [Saccharopolyspora rhizosphaerae]
MTDERPRLGEPVHRFADLPPDQVRGTRNACTALGSLAIALSVLSCAVILLCGYFAPHPTVPIPVLAVVLGSAAAVMALVCSLALFTGKRCVRAGRFHADEAARWRHAGFVCWLLALLTSAVSALSFHSAVRIDAIVYGHLAYTGPITAHLVLLISPLLVATAATVATHQVLKEP